MNLPTALAVTFLLFVACFLMIVIAVSFGFIGIIVLIMGIGLVSCCFSETA